MRILLAMSLVVGLLPGCLAYNEECAAPADLLEPDLVIGWLEGSISVNKTEVRTRETAIGNLIADGYRDAYNNPDNPNYRDGVPAVHGAFENAGAIRNEGFCVPVGTLPREDGAPIHRVDLREVLPFTNRLVVVELTASELFEVLEHSVSALGSEDPDRGFFLQVSGMSFTVDCAEPGQQVVDGRITVQGSRVKQLVVDGEGVERTEGSGRTWRIASNDFLLQPEGNDDFVTLAGRTGLNSLGKYSWEVVEDFLVLHSSEEAPYSPPVGDRITQVGCD